MSLSPFARAGEREAALSAELERRKAALSEDRVRCERALADAYEAHLSRALRFDALLLSVQVVVCRALLGPINMSD